jgi:hypothetical protein
MHPLDARRLVAYVMKHRIVDQPEIFNRFELRRPDFTKPADKATQSQPKKGLFDSTSAERRARSLTRRNLTVTST